MLSCSFEVWQIVSRSHRSFTSVLVPAHDRLAGVARWPISTIRNKPDSDGGLPVVQISGTSLLPAIGRHGRKAIAALVGQRAPFFLGHGVVERGDIRIQQDQAIGEWCDRGPRRPINTMDASISTSSKDSPWHPMLAQGRPRGCLLKFPGRAGSRVQSDSRRSHRSRTCPDTAGLDRSGEHGLVWHGVLAHRGYPRGFASQFSAAIMRHADQPQSGVGGKIRMQILND